MLTERRPMYLENSSWNARGAYFEDSPSGHSHSKSFESWHSSSTSTSESSLDLARGLGEVSRNTSLTSNISIKYDDRNLILEEEEEDDYSTPIIDRVLRRSSFIPTRPAPKPPGYVYTNTNTYSARPTATGRWQIPLESWIDLSEDEDEVDEIAEEEPMPIQPYRRRKRMIDENRQCPATMHKIEDDIMRMLMENQTIETTPPLRLPLKEPPPVESRPVTRAMDRTEKRQSGFGLLMNKVFKRTMSRRDSTRVANDRVDWNQKRGSYFEFDYTI
jgi:hypothetical protein